MINYSDINITDWIQAVGAMLAIPAAIIGFITLFRRDKDKELRISSLVKIAEQTENNNLQLSYQVKELIRQNELFEKQITVLEKMSLAGNENAELEKQKEELKEQRYIQSLKPNFVHSTSMRDENQIAMILKNDGNDAIYKEIVLLENNNFRITPIANYDAKFIRNKTLEIQLLPGQCINIARCYCNFLLIYSDIEGRLYSQKIEGLGSQIKINPPEEYSASK